ncbi:MAG: hypothetical protein V4700_03405 [Pseudomonadota bacterium]
MRLLKSLSKPVKESINTLSSLKSIKCDDLVVFYWLFNSDDKFKLSNCSDIINRIVTIDWTIDEIIKLMHLFSKDASLKLLKIGDFKEKLYDLVSTAASVEQFNLPLLIDGAAKSVDLFFYKEKKFFIAFQDENPIDLEVIDLVILFDTNNCISWTNGDAFISCLLACCTEGHKPVDILCEIKNRLSEKDRLIFNNYDIVKDYSKDKQNRTLQGVSFFSEEDKEVPKEELACEQQPSARK